MQVVLNVFSANYKALQFTLDNFFLVFFQLNWFLVIVIQELLFEISQCSKKFYHCVTAYIFDIFVKVTNVK